MAISKILAGELGRALFLEKIKALAGSLVDWRRNPLIQLMDAQKSKGRVLDFVKGLRISARVAYVVRDMLSTFQDIEVSWGHVVDEKGVSCSPECDIIVHHKGYFTKWNGGDEKPIMDFKFIDCERVIAVISCKSFAKSIDANYPALLSPYGVKNVFLVAECCAPGSRSNLQDKAVKAGYLGFYPLYLYDEKKFTHIFDEPNLMVFIKDLLQLAEAAKAGTAPTYSSEK